MNSNAVLKFPLGSKPAEEIIVRMPAGAQILTVKNQVGSITLWAECNASTDARSEPRVFAIVGTGWKLQDRHRKYIGTVIVGSFVWHVYELLSDRRS